MATPHLDAAKKYHEPPPPGSPFSVALPGTAEPDRTPVYRHWRTTEGLIRSLDPAVQTGHDMFEFSAKRAPKANCFGRRPWDPVKKEWGAYIWEDYGTVAQRRANFGVGIVQAVRDAGVSDSKFGVGLWCQNRPEWQITDLACMSQSLFSVSLYDTLGPDAIEYIANHAELPIIVTSLPHVPTLIRLKAKLPHLRVIVSLDPLEAGEADGLSKHALLSQFANQVGVKLYSIQQVEKVGEALGGVNKMRAPVPEDIVTINYTSGTTGPPKGVVLTHANAVAAACASLCVADYRPTDVGLSYLPLAHIYGRLVESSVMYAGSALASFHGNALEIVDDLKLVRPTGFQSVPRLWNRFGALIKASTIQAPGIKGKLSQRAVEVKLASMEDEESAKATNKHWLYDRIWSRKVSSAIGLERTRNMISGSAPLDPAMHKFLRAVFGNNLVQGWGMTETFAIGLCQAKGDMAVGTCGGVTVNTEICLQSVPDMDYLVTDQPEPRGEMLVRGESLFREYFRNEEETNKSFLPGGWFRTGDICAVDARGRFRIIDRRKNVLKLAQGEYISPERIENAYLGQLSYLAQAYVHGDGHESWLVAIFGVSPDLFAPLASKVLHKKINPEDLDAVRAACKDDKVRAAVLKDLDRVAKKSGFQGFEKVKALQLDVEPFTIENELLTPTYVSSRPLLFVELC